MRKQLFIALYVLCLFITGVLWIIVPETVPQWTLQGFGAVFIVEAFAKFIPLYKEYKGRRIIKKFFNKK